MSRKQCLRGGEIIMALCGVDCCRECTRKTECGGCEECEGHPFGGRCIAV